MSIKNIVMSAAGNSGDSKTYIEDVFSTYLYTGNGSTQTINNGIDLAGKGGLVWIKGRNNGASNFLFTPSTGTLGGYNTYLWSDITNALSSWQPFQSYNSNGFTVNGVNSGDGINFLNNTYASWTFRKAPKFFDVVTWTGNGVGTYRTFSHSLGMTPGMIIIKTTSVAADWGVYHRSAPSGFGSELVLNTTAAATTTNTVQNVNASTFDAYANGNGISYVAYLFAHDTTTDGLIQCGSYTGNGSATGPSINLGWEPQYLMIKRTDTTGNWMLLDNMRGVTTGSTDADLMANSSAAETASNNYLSFTSTGFDLTGVSASVNASGGTYIYMAIRRGPMRTPTDGTKVFKPLTRQGTGAAASITGAGFTPDCISAINRTKTGASAGSVWIDKLRGPSLGLISSSPTAEASDTTRLTAFDIDGVSVGSDGTGQINQSSVNYINYLFKRAPGFFDVVCYTGTGVARTVNHNLGVVPELMIVKRRSTAYSWFVYAKPLGATQNLELNSTGASSVYDAAWNNTEPTSSVFTVKNDNAVNASGSTYVAYLFASCPGVSKVGSYTGNGTNQTINCGFTNGARFVMIKRTDSTGDWYVWDTARGIVAGNDGHLSLNSTAAEVTTDDTIDPDSTGFIVNQVAATNVNVTSATYIYLAIA